MIGAALQKPEIGLLVEEKRKEYYNWQATPGLSTELVALEWCMKESDCINYRIDEEKVLREEQKGRTIVIGEPEKDKFATIFWKSVMGSDRAKKGEIGDEVWNWFRNKPYVMNWKEGGDERDKRWIEVEGRVREGEWGYKPGQPENFHLKTVLRKIATSRKEETARQRLGYVERWWPWMIPIYMGMAVLAKDNDSDFAEPAREVLLACRTMWIQIREILGGHSS